MKFNERKSGDGNSKRNTHEVEAEGTNYAPKSEQQQHKQGANASYSEKSDVTPPNHKEVPSGPIKADFEAKPLGRRTARMVGHEPGTESL